MIDGWVVAGLAVAGSWAVALGRVRGGADRPGVRPWSVLLSLLGATGVGIAVLRAAGGDGHNDPLVALVLIAACVGTAVLWIGFVFSYTGRGPELTARRWAGLALLCSLAIASTTATWLHHVGRVDLGALGQLSYVSTFVLQISVFSLGVLGVAVVARSTAYDDLPVRTGVVLVGCGLAISLLPYAIPLGRQVGGVATSTIAFVQVSLIVGAFTALALGRWLFDRAPTAGHLARETVLDTMSQPVFVVDRETRLLDVNDAARATFDVGRGPLRTRRLSDVTGLETLPTGSIGLETTDGQRQFLVRRTTISDDAGTAAGYAYRFRDVTDRTAREQRVAVLNRVIRHNLRNDLDAIRGFAEPIRDGDVDADRRRRYFERIEAVATDLVDLAGAVERSDRLLAREPLRRERVDLGSVARTIATGRDERGIAVTASETTAEVRSDRRIVRLVLEELVDNAIEHADDETSSVEIAVTANDVGATLAVRDDGPGIPEYERDVLLDGAETDVAHGSGVGLWLVQWAVARLGGTLEFSSNDPRGSVVTVRLRDLRRSASTTRPDGTS